MPEALPARARTWCMAAGLASLVPLLLELNPPLAISLALVAVIGGATGKPWHGLVRAFLGVIIVGYVLASHGLNLGRDTGIALLAGLLALKFYEVRHLRDARSLLGFSMFAPFAAFLEDQGPLTLFLALPAMAMILLALSVLAEQRPDAPPPKVGRQRLGEVGIAVAVALPLALAGFWLFPRLGSPLWGMPENALDRSGLGERMTPDEWVEMFADDAPTLRVRFEGTTPPRWDLYWRGQVLWDFDGQSWSRGAIGRSGPAPVREPITPVIRYEIALEPTDERYLVTLDAPLQTPEGSEMGNDMVPSTSEPITSIRKYTGVSALNTLIAGELSLPERRAALALPPGLNPRTLALARSWRREAGNDITVVRRALEWIGQDFSYSLTVPPAGRNAVDDFLFETRVGFCQHFSSAFANLMRAAGIPSRVVLGYSGGYQNRYGGYWIVRRMDAHAWTEVWLEGRGWIRVDPTAAVAPERVLDTVDDLARSEALLPETLAPLRDLGDWARRSWNEMVLGFNAARQASLLRPFGVDQASTGQLGLAFTIGAGLALGLTLWILMRGRPAPRHPVERAWLAFVRRMGRAGLAKEPWEAPLSFGTRLAAALPGQAGELLSLSRRYAGWRYAPDQLPSAEEARLIAELQAYRPATRPRRSARPGEYP